MRVVNVRLEECTHYIGRRSSWSSHFGKFADLGNPFLVGMGRHGTMTRDNAIAAFESWVRTHPEAMQRIKELPADAVLGCWCKPHACHGDVIVKIWTELREHLIARECKAADDAHERDLDNFADDSAEDR